MSSATHTPTRPRRESPPFDPHAAVFQEETWRPANGSARLHFFCPSRRANAPGYVMTCEEDGSGAWCSDDGYARWGHCTHTDQAAEIVRLTFTNIYAALPDAELRRIDAELTARSLTAATVSSIRYDVLGEELAKRARLKDPAVLNERGRRAKADLFD